MEENRNRKPRFCQDFCKTMVPMLVLLLLMFAAVHAVGEARDRRDKHFVVLTQKDQEILRVPLEEELISSKEVPVICRGEDLGIVLEIRGKSARLLPRRGVKGTLSGIGVLSWIHEKEDVFVFEPYDIKLYFE